MAVMNKKQAKQVQKTQNSVSRKEEQILQQSELELSIIYDLAPIMMCVVDENMRLVKCNKAALEFTGRPEHEIIGLQGGEAIGCLSYPDDPACPGYGPLCETCIIRNAVLDTIETGISHHNIEAELPFATREGKKTMSFLLSTTQLSLPDAKRAVMCIQDITERKQKEKELTDSALSYGTLLGLANRAKLGIAVTQDKNNEQGKLVFTNEEFTRISGYTEEELLSMAFDELLPQRMLPWLMNIYEKRQSGESVVSYYEAAILTKSGDEVAVEISADVMVYDRKLATIIFVRDISERKRMEENIKHRLKIEQALASVSSLFTSQEDIDINEVLRILGEVVSANRAYIFQMRDIGEIAVNTHEWCSPRTEPQIQNLQEVDMAQASWWMKKIRAGENIIIPDVDALPAEAANEKEILQAQDIRSLLVVPIYMPGEKLAGYIGFDDTETCRQWSNEDVSLLKVAAEMLSNYWERRQKVEELRDSETRYRTLVDTASRAGVGIAVVQDRENKQGKLVFVNEESARIFGYSEEELLDMTFEDVLPPRMLPWFRDTYVKRQSGETVRSSYEAALLKKNGDELAIEISADVTIYDGKLATIAFFRDITERKRMEEELRDSESRYKTLVDTASRSGVGIAVVQDEADKQGKLIFVNEESARASGYTEGELLDMTFDELLPQRIRSLLMDNYVKRQSGETVAPSYEAAILTKDGQEKAVELSVSVTVYGGKLATIAFFRDITERKRMEEDLARQTTVLSTVMENTGTQLVYLDREFNYIMANKAYIDASGYSWEELEGKNHFSSFRSEAIDTEPIKELFRKARDTGEIIFRNDIPYRHSGQPRYGISYWDSTLVPVKDDKGNVTGLVLSLIETTERKKMEQMKDEFIALVSHELRTPITVISGSLQLIKGEGLSIEEKQELIQNAIECTDDLSDILENMLELSRHQTGRLMLNTERIDIGSITNGVVNKMKKAGAGQRFQLEFPEVLPMIDADPLRVERILNNLIENAVKYSPADSEIKITVQCDTNFLVTSVIDQGKGISAGIKHNLFKMFERGDDNGMIHGTGLGLVVCKRLVEAHFGWIEAESESGRGATFSFGLPLRTQALPLRPMDF